MIPRSSESRSNPLATHLFNAARYYLGSRRVLLALAATAIGAGLAFNWNWLVAAGIAPLLLGVLPCVAMCALGLCMNKMAGRSDSSDPKSRGLGEVAQEPFLGTGHEGLKRTHAPSA